MYICNILSKRSITLVPRVVDVPCFVTSMLCFLVFPSEASPNPVKSSPETSPMTSPRQRRDSDRYCQLCNAWFNNPGMAQQHYDGKKHKKNAARADLLEQLGKTLDMGEMKGTETIHSLFPHPYLQSDCRGRIDALQPTHKGWMLSNSPPSVVWSEVQWSTDLRQQCNLSGEQ